jgi:hypothetical protein
MQNAAFEARIKQSGKKVRDVLSVGWNCEFIGDRVNLVGFAGTLDDRINKAWPVGPKNP